MAYEIQKMQIHVQQGIQTTFVFFFSKNIFFFHIYIYIYIYIYENKFTVKNKKIKKDIRQAPKHLRMRGTNLKTIKFNNI